MARMTFPQFREHRLKPPPSSLRARPGIIAKSGVPAHPIIEHLDIPEDLLCRFGPRGVVPMVHELSLECPKETFDAGMSQQLPFRLTLGLIVSLVWWAIWIATFSWWMPCCRCFTMILFMKIVSPAPPACWQQDSDQTARHSAVQSRDAAAADDRGFQEFQPPSATRPA